MLYHKFNREVMFGDKLLYYLANYTLQYSFERKIIKLIKNKKKLVVFDVGCYRGIFVKTILNLIGKRKYKFYLFEINRKAKKYLENILKLKNIYYNEIALCNKNGTANYNYNRFFESAGSSLSNGGNVRDRRVFQAKRFLHGLSRRATLSNSLAGSGQREEPEHREQVQRL